MSSIRSLKNEVEDSEDLKSMSLGEIIKLKEEVGAKTYNEVVLGGVDKNEDDSRIKSRGEMKRLNKNRPREVPAKRQVPFLNAKLSGESKKNNTSTVRDPRFDENSGAYNPKQFKDNYKFLTRIRQKEVVKLKAKLNEVKDAEERKNIYQAMQRLLNKNLEERKWHAKQHIIKEEKKKVQTARKEGKQPHFATKRELRVKELVSRFEELKKSGKLSKHLEKRRKKNAANDRKKLEFLK